MARVAGLVVKKGTSEEGIYDSITERLDHVNTLLRNALTANERIDVELVDENIRRVLAQVEHDRANGAVRAMPSFRDDVPFHVKSILQHLDPEPDREGLDDTPDRVARMYLDELCSGHSVDVQGLFRTFENEGYDGMITLKDIPVVSLCEHHLVPFVGHAHIGYFPNGKIVGLSKVARVVNAYTRRLQIQERLTKQVCDAIAENLEPRGVMVVIEAEHLCMTIRGVQAPGTKTITSAVTGLFTKNNEGEKDEFLRLIGKE